MDKDDETKNRIDNIEELLNSLNDFKDTKTFLEYVALVSENNEKSVNDAVNIMTIHAAKGLEFDVVFLPNWQSGVFPSPKTIDENGNEGLEEERRLAYVAITRAKKKLYISNSKYKYEYSDIIDLEPSVFVDELPLDKMNVIDNVAENSYNNYYNYKNKHISENSTGFYEKCFHSKFGYGYIKNRNNDKLTIVFDNYGEKVILKDFITIL